MKQLFSLIALALPVISIPVQSGFAASIFMPSGSTVWMELDSNRCLSGSSADCAGSNQIGPNPANGIPTTTYSSDGVSVTASAEALPNQVRTFLSGYSGFMYVSLQDTYTVHGSTLDPFNITVQLNMTGIMRTVGSGSGPLDHQIFGATVTAEIGTFNTDATLGNEAFRVTPFNSGTTATYSQPTIAGSSPQSVPFNITASHILANLLVGDTFNLAFGVNSAIGRAEIDMLNTGYISFVLPDGVYLTSALGGRFGETASAVPLPAALPLFASGLGLIGFLAHRRKRKAPAPAS